MERIKRIALVAHDSRKKDLIEWVDFNWGTLSDCEFVCTGTTGRLVEEALKKKGITAKIVKLKSGPLGGDVELSALIAEGKIDYLIFFWDPMEPQPHDVDVKALLRIATLYNIPTAMNRSTADFIISSPLFKSDYKPIVKNYSEYINRKIKQEK
ncbi:MAG: methylglyoxal synthase [Caldiserica bacterium CG02_land_8_20_14_3_00_36_38]|nr:MAG: methylglyoxal synthase [Caldiserica bacterium CG02_land_8_20_14_3_00_36_38]